MAHDPERLEVAKKIGMTSFCFLPPDLPRGGRLLGPLPIEARETRVHTWPQALLVGDAAKKAGELLAILGVQSPEQGFLVLRCDLNDDINLRAALLRDVEGVGTAVVRTAPALDESEGLELVHESHDATRDDRKGLAESALSEPLGAREPQKDSDVRRSEADLPHPLGKLGRDVGAEL